MIDRRRRDRDRQSILTTGESSRESVTGGAIYDAVILEAALEAGARELLTWNAADFERLSRGRLAVRTPSSA